MGPKRTDTYEGVWTMPVPKSRKSKCRRDTARAHKKLSATNVGVCPNCGARALPHRVCQSCGTYRGRTYKTIVKS